MHNALRLFFYCSIGVAAYALFRFLILPGDAYPYQWMATVIALGCMGAAFTITRVRREDS